jgi:hypothetical protein
MTAMQLFLYGLSALALSALALLVVLYWRNEQRERARHRQTRADITDMTILFQTMRDIIGQQKAMARSFNEEMEKKMALVRQILSQGMERNEKLYERQKQLEAQIDEAQARLDSLHRQLRHAADLARPGAPPPAPAPPTPEPPLPEPGVVPAASTAALRLDPWEPSDFELLPPAPEPETAPAYAAAPVAPPEESNAARQAFRALLDLDPVTGLEDEQAPGAAPSADANGGGDRAGAVVRQRVLEYHRAGMSVAEISRELGVGKGEVRLLLSLAHSGPA